jgi:hypothetical protein
MVLAACGNKTLDNSAIRIAAGELRSQAVQIKLIAATIPTDTTTQFYRSAQLSFLADKIRETREELSSGSPKGGLEQQLSRAQILGRQVNDELEGLVSSGENPAKAREIAAALEKLIEQFVALEASLRK